MEDETTAEDNVEEGRLHADQDAKVAIPNTFEYESPQHAKAPSQREAEAEWAMNDELGAETTAAEVDALETISACADTGTCCVTAASAGRAGSSWWSIATGQRVYRRA